MERARVPPDEAAPFRPADVRATAILIGLAFAVAVYGVAASRDLVAVVGLAAVAFAVVAMARGRAQSIRALERRCEVLGALGRSPSAPATTWRSRTPSWNEGTPIFGPITPRSSRASTRSTNGPRAAVAALEAAGDELAELAKEALDDPWEGT